MFQTHLSPIFQTLSLSSRAVFALRRLTFLLLLPSILLADTAEQPLSLRVRIYDYESLSSYTLESAKEVASSILGDAGVRISWEQCRVRAEDANLDASCKTPLSAGDIQLRIIGKAMAKKLANSRYCMGYALRSPGMAGIAGVYHHRAVDMEGSRVVDLASLLGAIMAHEIGHLLLKAETHSDAGIMQGQWARDVMRLIGKGRLRFTPDEAERMRADLTREAPLDLANLRPGDEEAEALRRQRRVAFPSQR